MVRNERQGGEEGHITSAAVCAGGSIASRQQPAHLRRGPAAGGTRRGTAGSLSSDLKFASRIRSGMAGERMAGLPAPNFISRLPSTLPFFALAP
jgi:hypothetical protein